MRISLESRYDGPIPYWEQSDYEGEGARTLRRMLSFNRRMARESGTALVQALRSALIETGAYRLRAWHDAVRLERRWRFHRQSHRTLAPLSR